MSWPTPFVVYRVAAGGKVEEVFRAKYLKEAKYWLTYIAQPGDVLCKTPIHPKHSGSKTNPEYWSHKDRSGKLGTDESQWKSTIEELYGGFTLPAAPQST